MQLGVGLNTGYLSFLNMGLIPMLSAYWLRFNSQFINTFHQYKKLLNGKDKLLLVAQNNDYNLLNCVILIFVCGQ